MHHDMSTWQSGTLGFPKVEVKELSALNYANENFGKFDNDNLFDKSMFGQLPNTNDNLFDKSKFGKLPSTNNNNAWWNVGGEGKGVFGLGSDFSFDNVKAGVGIAGDLFDSWTNYKNNQDFLKLEQQKGKANIANINARTETLLNRQNTLAANNANNVSKNGYQQQPVQQASTQQPFKQWGRGA